MSTRDLGRRETEAGPPRERLPQEQRPDRGSQEGSAKTLLGLLTATDRLTLAYLGGLAALAAWSHPKSGLLLLGIGILAIAVVGVAIWVHARSSVA